MTAYRLKLGEMLKKAGLVTDEQIEKVLQEQKRKKKPIGDIFADLGFVSEKNIAKTLAAQLEIPFVSFETGTLISNPDQNLINKMSAEIARQYNAVPLFYGNGILTVAMEDPVNVINMDNLRNLTHCEINAVIATKTDIKRAQDKLYGERMLLRDVVDKTYQMESFQEDKPVAEERQALDETKVLAESAPVVKLVDLLLMDAVKARASDIHIEPFEKRLSIRYRIDGELYEISPPAEQLIAPLISRVKIMSKMDIAEKRLPQDGAFSLKVGNKVIDFRVSSMCTIYGEKIAIRLFDKTSIILKLEELGLDGKMLKYHREAISKPHGLVFITGPTGSGKSTTLYASLKEIGTPDKNIITIEDPVEYKLGGINQVQVKTNIGLTFAAGVRTALRQDPDVILVGEVRDFETAQTCIRAALTGHLVLSTLHTNDAPSAIVRLRDFGLESFLIGSSLLLVEAQRLVRRLCQKCKEPYQPPQEEREKFNLKPRIYKAKGCDECRKSGYKGRIALYEVMPVTQSLRELIYKNANTVELKKTATKEGMMSLLDDGINKVNAGITSIEEVLAVACE